MKKLLIMFVIILAISFQALAQGDLLITPMRVVFEGNKLKSDLNLVNAGKDTATFSISFVNYNMNEDGSFTAVEKQEPGQMLAEPYLRVFPRKVTLAPGEPQVISLQCRRKPGMLAGEYRSHLYFRSEKKYSALGLQNPADTTMLSVQLVPIYGITIPIIIRTGVVNVSSTLSDLKLETVNDTTENIKLTINRTGNISAYGSLTVEYIPVQGRPYQIGIVKGVGVYTSVNKRNITIRLNRTPGMTFKNGKLKVQYTSNDDKNPVIYAEGELELK